MRHGFVIAIAVTLLVACKSKKTTETTDNPGTTTTTTNTTAAPTGWPDTTRTAFINDCIDNSKANMTEEKARQVCNCMQGKIEARYPNYADAATLTMQQMNDMAKECVQ